MEEVWGSLAKIDLDIILMDECNNSMQYSNWKEKQIKTNRLR